MQERKRTFVRHNKHMENNARVQELIKAAQRARVVLDRIDKRDQEYEVRLATGQISPA